MQPLSVLLKYCKEQARIESRDYFEPGYARPDDVAAWRSDISRRNRARRHCWRTFPARLRRAAEPLIPGRYGVSGRLAISADGEPNYTSGQYSPVEIYHALFDYLEQTNNV